MKVITSILSFFSKTPQYIILFTTSRCNARCAMCFNWDAIQNQSKDNELSLEEISKFSSSMSKVQRLTYSGGEPLLRADLPEITNLFYKNNGLETVVIPTNGLLFKKLYDTVKRILNENPKLHIKVCLSLDGPEYIHDKVRGVEGCYSKLKKAYDLISRLKDEFPKRDLEIQVNSTMSRYNLNSYKELSDCVERDFTNAFFNFNLARGQFPPLNSAFNPIFNNQSSYSTMNQLSYDEYGRLTYLREKYIQKKKEKRFIMSWLIDSIRIISDQIVLDRLKNGRRKEACRAGKNLLILTEKGECYPCETLWRDDKYLLGNIRDYEYSYTRIMKTKSYRAVMDFIKQKRCSCTFENAILTSLVYNYRYWPKVIYIHFMKVFSRTL